MVELVSGEDLEHVLKRMRQCCVLNQPSTCFHACFGAALLHDTPAGGARCHCCNKAALHTTDSMTDAAQSGTAVLRGNCRTEAEPQGPKEGFTRSLELV